MKYKFFLSQLKNIILNPAKAWETLDSKEISIKLIRDSFLLPLIIIVSVASFLGSLLFVNSQLSPVYPVTEGLKVFVLLIITVYSAAYILGEITYPLDLGKDFSISFRLIVFSLTPFLLCRIISSLFESLLFINITGLFGLYIFWTGAERMLNPPQYKKLPLLIATTVTVVGIYVVTDLLLTLLGERFFSAFFA
jgi:hypothetical protein